MWKEVLDFDLQADGSGRRSRSSSPASSSDARRRIRRRLERRRLANWLGADLAHGESLRLRPARVEPVSDGRTDRRRVDTADVRQRSEGRRRPSTASCSSRGRRTRTTPARSARRRSPTSSAPTTAPASSRRSATAGASGTAPTSRASAWIARSRPAPATSASTRRPWLRVYESLADVSRRSAAVHAPRAVHATCCTRERPSSSTSTTRTMRARTRSAGFVRAVAPAQGTRRRRALRPGSRRARVPGRPRDRLARRHQQLLPETLGHPRHQGASRPLSGTIRSRDDEVGRLHADRRDAVGDRRRRQGRELCGRRAVPRVIHVRWRVRHATTSASAISISTRAPPRSSSTRGAKTSDRWKADDRFPTKEPNGHSSTWHVTHAVELSRWRLDRRRRHARRRRARAVGLRRSRKGPS